MIKRICKNGRFFKMIEGLFQTVSSIHTPALLTAAIVFGLFSCGSEDTVDPEVIEGTVTEQVYEESYAQEEYQSGTEYAYKASEGARELPRITRIHIATLSPDVREGFEALVETDNVNNTDIDFTYEWKLNGEEILGITDQVIEWQDTFSKGDTLSVAVIPVSEIGQGVWMAEGSIVIPNSPPEIISEPRELFDGWEFNYTIEALDPDGDSFDYTLRGAPKGMTIEPATGLITWEYGMEDSGDYEVLIVVTDSEGAGTLQTLKFTIHDEGSPSR